jgi:hypothetical protein
MKTKWMFALVWAARLALLSGVWMSLGAGAMAVEKKKKAEAKAVDAMGSLLYANAVGEKGWSFLVLDGEDILPEGIAAGYRSSWVRYPVGARALQFEHQPLGVVDLKAELQADGLHAFVAYSDVVPQERAGRPLRPVLAVKELRCDQIVPAEKRHDTQVVLLNVTGQASLTVRINEETVELPRLQEVLFAPSKRSSLLEISVLAAAAAETEAREPLTTRESEEPMHFQRINAEDPGTRFVIYYSGAQNELESLLFDDVGMYGKTVEDE